MAKARRFVPIVLRVAAAAAAGVAAIVMATSDQTTTVFGVEVQAKFQYMPPLVYFVVANVIACAYSLLALVVPTAPSAAARLVLVADVVVGMLLTGAAASATAISVLGKNGNSHAGWPPICGIMGAFCDHATGALACGFVAVALHFLLLVHSIYTMNSS
uniref:Uncharacterized protein n=1 Tax=Avena sativa TaxID=4498 RepID=A0ACD5VWK4_AVESA